MISSVTGSLSTDVEFSWNLLFLDKVLLLVNALQTALNSG